MWRRNLLAVGLILTLSVAVAVLGGRRFVEKGFFAPREEPKAESDPNAPSRPPLTAWKIAVE